MRSITQNLPISQADCAISPQGRHTTHQNPTRRAAKRGNGSASEPAHASGPERDERSESLPCLYSNNCIEEAPEKLRKEQILALCGILAPYQKRQAHALFLNVERLIDEAPTLGHVGFFTLTTKDNVTDKAEFSRRWHSMLTNYWSQSPNFGKWLGVYEQQKRGAWHLHILVILPYDIRTGANLEEFAKGRYRTASPYLRSVWRELRGKCSAYGFGRHELLPIKSNAEGMARYVGKYISKHIGQREEVAKGKRLVTASQSWTRNSSNFAWNTPGAKEWRRKVALFAAVLGIEGPAGLYFRLGPNWAYRHLETIYNVDALVESLNRGVHIMHEGNLIDARTGEILF